MNDRHEGTHPSRALREICDQPTIFLPQVEHPDPKLLEALRYSLNNSAAVAVASFSSYWRSLPMYRMYTPPAGGFVIGFPRNSLQSIGTLIDVEYTDNALWQWARDYAVSYMTQAATIDTPTKTPQEINNELVHSTDLIRQRIVASLKFKSDEFASEAESRLIFMGGATHYRESRDGNYIVPYQIIDLPNIPIEAPISYGPNRDPRLAQDSTAQAIMAGRKAGTIWAFGQLSSGEYGFCN